MSCSLFSPLEMYERKTRCASCPPVTVFKEEVNCIVCLEIRADELMRRLISGELTNYNVVRTSSEPLHLCLRSDAGPNLRSTYRMCGPSTAKLALQKSLLFNPSEETTGRGYKYQFLPSLLFLSTLPLWEYPRSPIDMAMCVPAGPKTE